MDQESPDPIPTPLPAGDEALRFLAQESSAHTGEAFFHSLVQALAQALRADYVLLGEVVASPENRVRTLAVCAQGRSAENFDYALADTPCEQVVTKQICCYPRDVQKQFPSDRLLAEMEVEGYVGTPLRSSTGRVFGLLSVLTRRPLTDPQRVQALLGLFALRAAAEMERLQAEESLRRSEERFRALVEKSADGITLVAADGTITYTSPSSRFILGHSPEEMVGRNWTQFAHRDELARLRAFFSDVLVQPGKDYRIEACVRHKDGSLRHVEANCSNRLADPSVGAIVVNYRDITERKRSEEALRDSEEEYRLIVQNIDEIVWTFRVKDEPERGTLGFVSDQVKQIVGYSAEEFLQDPGLWRSLVHPDDVAETRQSVRQLLADNAPVTRLYRFRHRHTGAYRWLEDRLVPQLDEAGRVVGIFGVARDVTERKQAEEALRESEKRFRDLFEASPDAIFVEDLDGNVLDVNPAACRLHGASREELIHKNVMDLVPPEHRDQVATNFPQLIRGELKSVRGFSRSSGGQTVPVELMASRITYTGKPAVLLHVRDLTERERLEEQFRQSQKMEAVGRLAGGVAHDFNNLLTGICGYAELLLRGLPLNDAPREGLEQILRAGERAASLTRQLLAFSRKQVLRPRVLDLNDVVANMEKMLRRLIGEDIQLVMQLDPNLRPVKADPGQIEQVIMNLAINARDAMPQGGQLSLETRNAHAGESTAEVRPEMPPGPYSMLAVSDTGCGMSEDVQAHLFEPFFTTKEVGKGTGLGLATVYGIIKQSEGHILVRSTPGQGSSFRIYLPSVRETASHAEPKGGLAELPRGTETILLVEDEDTVRAFLRTVLKKYGYMVLEACNGSEALLLCERHLGEIALLLTDVVMPQMNGQELAQRLLQLRPQIKVLFVSGYSKEILAPQSPLRAGMAFLQKPFTSDLLVHSVRRMLDEEEAPPQ